MQSYERTDVRIVAAIAALALMGVFVYVLLRAEPGTGEVPTVEPAPDVSAQVSGAVETPAEQLPQTNPYTGYKNPFD